MQKFLHTEKYNGEERTMSNCFKKNGYSISTDKSKLDAILIYEFLSKTYWAKDRTLEQTKIIIEKAFCFGLYMEETQIGFARIVTDFAAIAYLGDVFVIPNQQGKGLGKWLIDTILKHEQLKNIKTWLLATKDAHQLYKKFGFIPHPNPEKLMLRSLSE